MATQTKLTCANGHQMHLNHWPALGQTKLVFQIVHGMAEHSARYDFFAQYLNKLGIEVYAADQRGHGYSAPNDEKLGHLADANGWNLLVSDQLTLSNYIAEKHPNVPIVLFGHSMGSFVSRNYAALHSQHISGLILSGTGAHPGFIAHIGKLIANFMVWRKGLTYKSTFIFNTVFGPYTKRIANKKTDFDWLTRDESIVKKYIADKYCGHLMSNQFWRDINQGVDFINSPQGFNQVRKNLPIYLISGDADPVGDYGKGVEKVYANYKKAGMQNVSIKLYKDARHELCNETNKNEIFDDISQWLKQTEILK